MIFPGPRQEPSQRFHHRLESLIQFVCGLKLSKRVVTAKVIINNYISTNEYHRSRLRAGSSVVVMFDSQSKGRGFNSRPVHQSIISLREFMIAF
jgi:hypothetical protein